MIAASGSRWASKDDSSTRKRPRALSDSDILQVSSYIPPLQYARMVGVSRGARRPCTLSDGHLLQASNGLRCCAKGVSGLTAAACA
jgi:hypothetical protein